MHTENTTPRVEAYIRTHRARIAVAVLATLAVVLYAAWFILSRTVLHVQSANLDLCVMGLSALAAGTVALAFYWGAE